MTVGNKIPDAQRGRWPSADFTEARPAVIAVRTKMVTLGDEEKPVLPAKE